jgi:hypothetical protein
MRRDDVSSSERAVAAPETNDELTSGGAGSHEIGLPVVVEISRQQIYQRRKLR